MIINNFMNFFMSGDIFFIANNIKKSIIYLNKKDYDQYVGFLNTFINLFRLA
jgi:hypothetical protein